MKNPVYLMSTHNGRTFMMTSYDPKTIVIFENPVKELDKDGNELVFYTTIEIRKM
ncbi:hypothetical protein pEaSNUABM50_00395 [Erwinia phage pEa_SNUABM_50]|uniref:Uncharacterized protein n=4 Tax=Eneladusvirus BF TaxID=2560751 RepID=A0A7L8ZN16_9CAUD|nr:hypothetical protein FDH34_gp525 [Serratia phage BF]QOI71334.1 hypothetical protein pEaSNUABM12_00401 [Erwinia phage pEa_SNUABM_12]QOI71876.1 hypothetical protein pEaSNUABM47_00397 [Erwinia phage pEa_SNUABM_47]QOI72415.1 hypothetical protein pEaSNUABM50_00395 [Erwinia phage pEa_SNUABM_50]QXO11542.1 hypothetical protein pEaSNUABM19_00401 [Erwinia phage pEa_SNUABM_19]QXO12090.1 hypothetical protein pEaSNUABM44_00399 [Erwinia phage pEa_SNUABM_44]QXO12643.1 hypothetical protein pEaSNUABM49_004